MKDNNQNKELTLSDIAQLINATKTDLEAKIETSIHELATMNQNQFLELGKKINNVENGVEEIKSDIRDIKANLNKKVDKIDHNTLTYRVEKLEKKFA